MKLSTLFNTETIFRKNLSTKHLQVSMTNLFKRLPLGILFSIILLNLFSVQSQIDVFSDNFATNSTTWRTGNSVTIPNTDWSFCSLENTYAARVANNYLEITNKRESNSARRHAQGFAYVTCGGTGSLFNSAYNSVLSSNTGVVTWTFNMRKDATADGGFSCSNSSQQNNSTIGLAFILATSSASGMLGATNNCNTNATASGYAVIFGDPDNSRRPKLVRFTNGLHNGAITVIAEWPDIHSSSKVRYMNVKVTYNPCNNAWALQCRDAGTATNATGGGSDPSTVTYNTAVTGTDATHVNTALNYMGGYFQAGCSGTCNTAYIASFKQIKVNIGANTSSPLTAPSPQSFCSSSTVADLIATGTGLQWYTSSSGGSPLAPTTLLTSATYYVSQTSCQNVRIPVVVIINSSSTPTIIANPSSPSCGAPVTLNVGTTDMITEPMAGLVAHYPFHGNLNDVSGRNLNLSGTGNFSQGGLLLNGTIHESAVTDILDNDYHTISFYAKYTQTPTTWGKIFGYEPGGTGGDRSPGIWTMQTLQGLHWRYNAGNTGFDQSVANLNQWYHIVGVKDGATFRIYVDGNLVQTTSVVSPKGSGNATLRFGGGPNVVLRDFKIFNRTISAAEVNDLAVWEWYADACGSNGGTLVGKGPEITINPTVTTEYFLRAKNLCGETACVGYTFAGAPRYTAGNISVGPRMTNVAHQQLGVAETPLIPDASITASHQLTGHEVWRGRLFNQYWYAPDGGGGSSHATSWASANGTTANYIQVDLGQNRRISGVITQSRGYDWYPPVNGVTPYNQRVISYTVQYSIDGTTWENVDNGATFTANTLFSQDPVTNVFQQICNGRYVRINVPAGEFLNHMSARMDVISHPCTDSGPYNISASASLPKDVHGRQGAYTIRWYTGSSGGTSVHEGQYVTRSLAANATETLHAATYFNDGAGNTCESTIRTPVTISAEVLHPANQASIPTHATNFSVPLPAGWRTGNSVTDSRTLDCSGRAAVLDQLGDYVWVRTNASANYLDYTLKVTGNGRLLVQQSQDGCVWTTIATHTNTPTAITKHQQIGLLNTSRHFRFHITGNGATFEVDDVRLYNTPPVTTLSDNTDNVTCDVYGNHWIHFLTSDNQLIASVNAQGNDIGNVTAYSYIDAITTAPYGNPILTDACDDPSLQTSVLGRHWTIDPLNSAANASAIVRLPYYRQELTLLIPATGTSSSPYDGVSTQGDLGLSKYSGPANVNNLWSDNCPPPVSTGNGGTTWQPNNGIGNLNTYIQGFPNTSSGPNDGLYSQFNISGFSEFWLHASNTIVTPLAVVLSNFSASCDNKTISWITTSEQNSSHFVVEQSRNGYEWSAIETVEGAGTTNAINNYLVNNNLSANYYRLKQVDFDGKIEYFGPIHIDCGSSNNALTVYPNPTNGTFTVAISSSEELGESTIFIHDVSGKIVAIRDVNVLLGTNTVQFENNELMPGTYIVSVKGKEKNILNPVRLVVQ